MWVRNSASVVLAAALLATGAGAQTIPMWNQVAGFTVSTGLAGPATGPVQSVWYVAGGSRLQVETESHKIFETADFQHWKLNSVDSLPPAFPKPPAASRPEAGV